MICHLFLVQELSCDPCKLHIISNRFRWDRSIRITPNSTSSVSVAPTLVSTGGSQVAQWVTRSPLLRLVPYCGPPPYAHHYQHSFFLRRKFFCGLDGAGDAPTPPRLAAFFPPPTPNHLFPTVCDGRCSETCPAPDSANLGGLLVMLVSFQ